MPLKVGLLPPSHSAPHGSSSAFREAFHAAWGGSGPLANLWEYTEIGRKCDQQTLKEEFVPAEGGAGQSRYQSFHFRSFSTGRCHLEGSLGSLDILAWKHSPRGMLGEAVAAGCLASLTSPRHGCAGVFVSLWVEMKGTLAPRFSSLCAHLVEGIFLLSVGTLISATGTGLTLRGNFLET